MELEALVAAKPLGDVADDPKRLQVWFLAGRPKAAAVKELEAADVAPEVIAICGPGRQLEMRWAKRLVPLAGEWRGRGGLRSWDAGDLLHQPDIEVAEHLRCQLVAAGILPQRHG